MFVIIVYDTEAKNCVKLHKHLKKYLNWNQNSVFEGIVTKSQYFEIKDILDRKRAEKSHITLYIMENEKLLTREELGEARGNVSNII
ncbi:MAG: CRISPR-associated endonuclease Cas2 [Candidatus Thermoplasmatota archaeon]|nr:CRISPR-associated endonuclease Cas2 [Candidatus Thermoplasmatota archaeon]